MNNSTHARACLRAEAVRPIQLSRSTLFWPNAHDVMENPRSDWSAGEVSHGRRGQVAIGSL